MAQINLVIRAKYIQTKSRFQSDFKGPVGTAGKISMTSFMIQSHVGRQVPLAWAHNDTCPFCRIISGELPSQTVYETEKVIAILGIHLLVLLIAFYKPCIRYSTFKSRAYSCYSKSAHSQIVRPAS